MKRLPVPPLAQSMARYLEAVKPLLSQSELTTTQQVVAEFLEGAGPVCQAELERHADVENEAGSSWLTEDWLAGYLDVSTSLPLTSNIGCSINWPTGEDADCFAAAADFVCRIAAVHLSEARGETAQEISPRGEPQSMEQWKYLRGGIRHPRNGRDELRPGPQGGSDREIVVLSNGYAFAVRISDHEGKPIPRPAVQAVFRDIVRQTVEGRGHFADLAYLGSDRAAHYLDSLLQSPHNAETYDRLTRALFVVNLVEEAADDDTHQAATAFGLGRAWPLKPVSYQVGLADGWIGEHVEHSTVDGAPLNSVVARAKQMPPAAVTEGSHPLVQSLVWEMTDRLMAELAVDADAYRVEADHHRLQTVRVPVELPRELSFKLSMDGAMQWVMLYAQLAAYGRLRSTYESVAMLEYQAGRTECLRPNTAEAVALATALLNGTAAPGHLHAAARAHSAAVIACKTGQAIDRHLLGLRSTATRLGLRTPALFNDVAYRRLVDDFLSTTSLGHQKDLIRLAFAPTSPDGIGVYYTPVAGAFEFMLIYRDDGGSDIDQFIEALSAGTAAVAALVELASAVPPP